MLEGKTIAFLVAPEGPSRWSSPNPGEGRQERRRHAHPDLHQARRGPGFNHLDRGDTFPVDVTLDQVEAADFRRVAAGGVAHLFRRTMPRLVRFVRDFFDMGKPVAAICRAVDLIEADVVGTASMTSWPSLQTDLRNAGATWKDRGGGGLPRMPRRPWSPAGCRTT